jgi:hypothetical protein
MAYFIALIFLLLPQIVFAFNPKAHALLTRQAVENSNLDNRLTGDPTGVYPSLDAGQN